MPAKPAVAHAESSDAAAAAFLMSKTREGADSPSPGLDLLAASTRELARHAKSIISQRSRDANFMGIEQIGTPCQAAVAGMSWGIPAVPLGLTASASKRLSCLMPRAKNSTGRASPPQSDVAPGERHRLSAVGRFVHGVRWPSPDSVPIVGRCRCGACSSWQAYLPTSAQASSGPIVRRIAGVVLVRSTAKRAGRRTGAAVKPLRNP